MNVYPKFGELRLYRKDLNIDTQLIRKERNTFHPAVNAFQAIVQFMKWFLWSFNSFLSPHCLLSFNWYGNYINFHFSYCGHQTRAVLRKIIWNIPGSTKIYCNWTIEPFLVYLHSNKVLGLWCSFGPIMIKTHDEAVIILFSFLCMCVNR